jgi:hypothetical protein
MISNQKSKYFQIKKILREWSLFCTFHCYPKVFHYKNNFLRIIWFVLFALFTAFTCFLVCDSLFDYFEYDVVSKIQVLNVDHLEFPTITICDANLFPTKYAGSHFEKIFKNLTNKSMSDFSQLEMGHLEFIYNFIKFNAASLSDAEKSSFSFGKESFLSCLFNLKPCNITKDLTWFYSMDLRNCFQFNSIAPLQKTILQGELNGLSLTIGPLVNSNLNNLNPYSVKGLRLYIKEDTHMPTLLDECIFVSPGQTESK